MIFADVADFETAKSELKKELKNRVTESFDHILQWYGVYNIWGHVLESTKPAFMKFTKGHKEPWCEKMSLLFETSFDCVVKVVYVTTLNVTIDVLHVFIDEFFENAELFNEDWFLCSKCFRSTYADSFCESCDTNSTPEFI